MPERWIGGKYRLGSLLGRGGMGVVYEAVHGATGKRVAVKLIDVDAVRVVPDHVARFEREARAAGSVDTQHIVQVLDAGSDAQFGTPYIAMELLTGEDLLRAVQRLGPLPPLVVVRIAAQALMGLTKAHDAGVVHRDIKSANLFLALRDEDEIVVKLLDFGIAKIQPNDLSATQNTSITRTGSMLGSPLYMSPEQARGSKDVDARTDLWSLGVVMYEALTGAAPHHDITTLGELILAICSAPCRQVQDAAPWVPPGVARVVHRALAIRPEERYGSAREMLDAVRALLPEGARIVTGDMASVGSSERKIVAPRYVISAPGVTLSDSDAKARSLALDATVSDASGAGTQPGGPRRPRRGAVVAAVAIAGAAAVVAGAFAVRARHPPDDRGRSVASAVFSGGAAEPLEAGEAQSPPVKVDANGAMDPRPTVHLRVGPSSARAEVDGIERPVEDGRVAITGSLGSLHAVRLWIGAREARTTVAITESGPLPDALVLDERPGMSEKARVPPHAAAKSVPPPGAPSSPRAPGGTEADGGLHMDTVFQ